MIRMFPRRRIEVDIESGFDTVISGLSLPSDSILNGMWMTLHIFSNGVLPWTTALMYQIQGYILPVLDPDNAPSFDTLWDTLVPKDDDTDTIDLDTAAADVDSMFEPGEMALAEVMDVGLQPEKIYSKQFLKTAANARLVQEEAGVLEWAFADVHKIRLGKRRRYRCDGPSAVMYGLGNPSMDDTIQTPPNSLSENEWARVKYIGTVLEQALMQHFGLTEAGAETPWIEAAQLLRKYLEPDVVEENAASWGAAELRLFANVTYDVSVVGTMEQIQIGSGG